MTKTIRDVPAHEGATIGDRLKVTRLDAGKTRKALQQDTGISASTLDKYERGDMDPNTTRLKTLCDHLDVSFDWVLNGEEIAESDNAAENGGSVKQTAKGTEHFSTKKHDAALGRTIDLLQILDVLRGDNFSCSRRRAEALMEEAKATMKYLEPEELIQVAQQRDLFENMNKEPGFLENLFVSLPNEAKTYCGNIEERILDTAVLGTDLYRHKIGPLHSIGNNIPDYVACEKPIGLTMSWSDDHDVFVPHIREAFRTMALSGQLPEIQNIETYPLREEFKSEETEGSSFEDFL